MFHNYLEWNVSHYCLTKAVPCTKTCRLRKTEGGVSKFCDCSVTAFIVCLTLLNNQGWTFVIFDHFNFLLKVTVNDSCTTLLTSDQVT